VADLGLDLGVVHPGIVIPGAVVGPHVLEAEPIVAFELDTRFGRTKLAPARAARMVATADRRFRLGRENRIARVAPHHAQYGWLAAA
jgi:hypothetical protein